MALFRRRSQPEEAVVEDEPAIREAVDAAEVYPVPGYDRSQGPFDESEAHLADQALTRIDLGSLRIPGLPGIGLQVETDANQQVMAVTGVGREAAVQLQAFAAPRSEGLWDEVRAEMRSEISATAGARITEEDGPFGPELRAVLPTRSPEGAAVRQNVRFVGIDGPRWFLRAVFLGRAATRPDPGDDLHRLVRQTVVVRGGEAMAPRDPLPLHLPAEPVPPGAEGETGDEQGPYGDLDPFQRGPEITEVR